MKKFLILVLAILTCFTFVFSVGCSDFGGDYEKTDYKAMSTFAKQVSGKDMISYSNGVNIELDVKAESSQSQTFKIHAIDNGI